MTCRYLDHPYLLAGRQIDPITGTLSYRETQKHLRRKELEVLALLAEAADRFVPRNVFIEQVWQGNPMIGEQGLTDTIAALRRSLCDTDRAHPLIQTIPRRGYQLRATVRLLSRDGGVVFAAGSPIDGRPGWRLSVPLEQTEVHESWLAEQGSEQRVFRFCRHERHLRRLRREVVLMRYVREALAGRADVSIILDWQLDEPPYFLELAAPGCGNLRSVLLGESAPKPLERLRLLGQIAEALAAVHAAGVVHRNLSPDSVLVDLRAGAPFALLGEFGSAALDDRQRLGELEIDADGLSLQTALLEPASAYAAPEIAAGGPATAASDVYALGVLIAQSLRGDFQNLEFSGIEAFGASLAESLCRCCTQDPSARPTAAQVGMQLRQLVHEAVHVSDRAEAPAVSLAEPTSDREQRESAEPVAPAAPIEVAPAAASSAVIATLPEPAASAHVLALDHERIGRYRILDKLAQGGMGVVYLAEQSEPVQRRVALKLIRAGLDSAQVLARFGAERQALAMLNHPNISAIFDAGSTPEGHPYFAMEFVPGKDIKSHCDAARLNLHARIHLFLQVCDGVLHAHQKGLIHRDLKPGNILVKQQAEQPALVKLIDFGVAKSLIGHLGAGLHTRLGSFVGTPVYSCPEQVTDPTREIDNRADLYSLGIVLYELLAGIPPRTDQELDAQSPAELARRLRDVKTPPMGSRFASLDAADQLRIAELRALSRDGLSMQLCSDLDWIVGKCIAFHPEDRYATVQDLRLDLKRWLEDRPIEARPQTSWYRFRKLVRRNRLTTGLVCLVLGLLIATTATAVWGFLKAEREAHLARDAADQAQRMLQFQQRQWERLDAELMGIRLRERLNDALGKSFAQSMSTPSPTQMLEQVNFTDLIIQQLREDYFQTALQTIEQEYAQRPELQHLLRQSIAETLQTLGIHDRALQVQELALRQRQTLLGPDADLTLQSLFHRGQIQAALAKEVEARADFQKAHEQLTAKHSSDHPAVVLARFGAAQYNMLPGDPVQIYRETLRQRLDSHGAEDIWVHRMRVALAHALTYREQHAEAFSVMEDEIRGEPAGSRAKSPRRIETLTTLGTIRRQSGDIFGATRYFKQALDAANEVYGSTHSVTLSAANALAYGLMYSGRPAEGEALMRKTQAAWQLIHGADNPLTVWFESIIADAAWMQGRLREATDLMGECAQRMPSDNSMWFSIAVYHGMFLRDIGDLDAARRVLRETIDATEDQGNRRWGLTELGKLEHLAGNLDRAEELLVSVHTASLTEESSDSVGDVRAAGYLGGVWRDMGKAAEARQILEKAWPKQSPWEAFATIQTLAQLEHEQGNRSKARELAQKALELGRKHLGPRSREWKQLSESLAVIESTP